MRWIGELVFQVTWNDVEINYIIECRLLSSSLTGVYHFNIFTINNIKITHNFYLWNMCGWRIAKCGFLTTEIRKFAYFIVKSMYIWLLKIQNGCHNDCYENAIKGLYGIVHALWRHWMETWGNPRVNGEFPSQRASVVTWALAHTKSMTIRLFLLHGLFDLRTKGTSHIRITGSSRLESLSTRLFVKNYHLVYNKENTQTL